MGSVSVAAPGEPVKAGEPAVNVSLPRSETLLA